MLKLAVEHIEKLEYSFDGHMRITPKTYPNPYDTWYFGNLAIPSDMVEHLPYLCQVADRAKVLELGTRYGVSTSAFAKNAEVVWTVDREDCSRAIPKGIDNVHFIQEESTRIDYEQLGIYPDIVLIDTEHTFNQVIKEFEHIIKLTPVKVLFHDYQIPEVGQAIEYIAKKYEYPYTVMGKVFPLVEMIIEE